MRAVKFSKECNTVSSYCTSGKTLYFIFSASDMRLSELIETQEDGTKILNLDPLGMWRRVRRLEECDNYQ